MKFLGGLLLINVIIVSTYFIFASQVSISRIAVFGAIGLFFVILLMFYDRITGVKVSGVGEITTVVERAIADAEEIEKIRKEVEKHRDAITLIVRDTNTAREDLEKVRLLSNDARGKADELAKVLAQAQETLEDIRTVGDFGLLLMKVSNDDRPAFDSLRDIAGDWKHRFCAIAKQALIKIITDPQVTGLLSYPIDWQKDYGIDPAKATLEQLVEVYTKEPPFRQSTVLLAMWDQNRFPKSKRLQVLYEVIQTTPSLRCLHCACDLMNKESKVGKNILAYDEYLKWWEENRLVYVERENAGPKNPADKQ